MIWRAIRTTNRFASVAESVNCQSRRPKRRCISSPTSAASGVGSIAVIPLATRSWTAATVGGGEWPVIAPVSPRQRSAYTLPSTSVTSAPEADSKNTGNAPGHRVIQFIGTPESSDASARAWSSRERGCASANRSRSRANSSAIRDRSIPLIRAVSPTSPHRA